jgi:hypothetical protein
VVTLPDVGDENSGESCGTVPYSSTIGNSTSKSAGEKPTDEQATATATLAGDEPTEDALAARAEDDVEHGVLDCPKNAWTDGGTDWSLSKRVFGWPDAEDGGG